MSQTSKNIIFDTDYTKHIKNGGRPKFKISNIEEKKIDKNIEKDNIGQIPSEKKIDKKENTNDTKKDKKKISIFDKFFNTIFGIAPDKNDKKTNQDDKNKEIKDKIEGDTLDQKIKNIINMPDDEFKEDVLTNDVRQYITNIEKNYLSSLSDYKSHIAPTFWEVKSKNICLSGIYAKTYYASAYPSYMEFLWSRDLLSLYGKWDASWFIYPGEDLGIQSMLKKRATQLKAEMSEAASKGITIDTEIEVEYRDVESIRQKLATREERYFEGSFYITLYEENEEKLAENSKKFEQKIGGFGIRAKAATQRMDEGFNSCLPLMIDDLGIYRSMVTTSLAGSFPFISNDLIENDGILYGINLHTGSLIIFDRFSKKLANANSVVLATSGAGKSFAVKLEILRYLLHDIDVIVIDPENEYKSLINQVGGTYINIAVNSNQYLNPFDIPPKIEDIEYSKGDLLRSQIMNLIGLISVLLGGISSEEEALLDKAIQATYSIKEINFDTENPEEKNPPIMQDLMNMLEGMQGGETLAIRISKYVTGTFGNLFNNITNIDLNQKLTVFSIRDLEEALKTPAMYNILNFIWTKVRSHKKRRLLIIDEAWIMMQNDVSGNFLYGLIKRARKYGVGVTTITQDVEDFLKSTYGKPIVSNASMQLLLKQSTASIKALESTFGLSEAEKQKLVSSNVGEGLFLAGNQHVAIKILASPSEKEFITTDV